jgi:hypothetical protein
MPAIDQLLSSKFSGFKPVEPHEAPVAHIPTLPLGTRNPFLRCPAPPLAPISSDNLAQWDLNGQIPQYRLMLGSH